MAMTGTSMHSTNSNSRRVVITGLGVISPIGCSIEEFWTALGAGRSGISRSAIDVSGRETAGLWGGRCLFKGRIEEFGELEPGPRKVIRKSLKLMNRETQLGVAAGQQALLDCGILKTDIDRERLGICFGAGNVSVQPADFVSGIDACGGAAEFDNTRWGSDGIPNVEPLWLLKCLPNMPSCHAAIINDMRGPNNCITQREAAANLAIAEACRIISDDDADAMLVGATGTLLQPMNHLHAMFENDSPGATQDDDSQCRPFDSRRGPMIPGEGAGAIVLENYDTALRRGAKIYGEVVGTGSSCVIDRGGASDAGTSMANAIRSTLRDASGTTDDVDHIHAHGLGTQRSDAAEAQAIREVFRGRADTLPIVAAKSNMGNCGAAGGAVEMVASLLAIRHGQLFPLLNYSEADPNCPIHPVVSATDDAGNCFLNLSMHPRGLASCVMVRRAA
jgi:3-oxoacyl-[acyl-carrier-protein] synthase II